MMARVLSGQFHVEPMTFPEKTKAICTDSHFIIPLLAFCAGLALLILLH